MLKNGWEIPPCIRRLLWLDTDKSSFLEACRLISGTYSFLASNEAEIQYHVLRLAKRNGIMSFQEHQRLRAITTFGKENPWLFACHNYLLHRFCYGACFFTKLTEEYEKPRLFEQV